MTPAPHDDLELMRKLRAELRIAYAEGQEIRDKKGYVDSEAREKYQRIEKDLNNITDVVLVKQNSQINDQNTRITDLEGKVKSQGERLSRAPGSNGGAVMPYFDFKTLGQQICETEEFQRFAKGGGRNKIEISIKSRIRPGFSKANVPTGSHAGVPAGAVPAGAVPGALAGTAVAADGTIVPAAAGSTIVSGGITQIIPPAGAYPIFPYRVGLIPQMFPPTVMRDVVPVIPLDSTNAVEYVRETWNFNADYVLLEGDRKPQSGVTYQDFIAPVRTIAHYVKISRQMAMDVPFLMAVIEQRLQRGVMLFEDKEILYGNNSAGHLWGLMPQATPTASFYTTPGPMDTSIDELNIAATWIEGTYFYVPNAIVLNPFDEAKIEMIKTTFGSYVLYDQSPREDGVMRLWGLPVIVTPHMNVGDYLVGSFPGTCALFDREVVTVEIAFQNEDDFVRNLITIRAEERIAFAVFVPQAYAKGPFQTPPGNSGTPFLGSTVLTPGGLPSGTQPQTGTHPQTGTTPTPHVPPATTPKK